MGAHSRQRAQSRPGARRQRHAPERPPPPLDLARPAPAQPRSRHQQPRADSHDTPSSRPERPPPGPCRDPAPSAPPPPRSPPGPERPPPRPRDRPRTAPEALILGVFPYMAVFSANRKSRYDARANYPEKFFSAARKIRHDARASTQRIVFSASSKIGYDAHASTPRKFFQRAAKTVMMRTRAPRKFFQRLPKPAMMRARTPRNILRTHWGRDKIAPTLQSSRTEAGNG